MAAFISASKRRELEHEEKGKRAGKASVKRKAQVGEGGANKKKMCVLGLFLDLDPSLSSSSGFHSSPKNLLPFTLCFTRTHKKTHQYSSISPGLSMSSAVGALPASLLLSRILLRAAPRSRDGPLPLKQPKVGLFVLDQERQEHDRRHELVPALVQQLGRSTHTMWPQTPSETRCGRHTYARSRRVTAGCAT